jgi:hypothetical protein
LDCYDVCVDDHSYLPTALVERCDRSAATATPPLPEHAIALTIEERDKIAPSRFLSLPPSSVSAARRFGSDRRRADMAGPAAGSAQARMTRSCRF